MFSEQYFNNTDSDTSDYEKFLFQAGVRHLEFIKNLPPYLNRKTMLLCHSASDSIVYGLAKLFRLLHPVDIPQCLINYQSIDESAIHCHTTAIRSIAPFNSVRLTASNFALCAKLSELTGKPTYLTPLPLDLYAKKDTEQACSVPIFGVVGELRAEKNFHLLSAAIASYLSTYGTGKFIIQLHIVPWSSCGNDITHNLEELQKKYPDRVSLCLEHIYGDEYYKLISRCDTIVLPYEPKNYHRYRSTQIIFEAGSQGVSCIVPCGSSMEYELKILDNGSTYMKDCSVPSLTGALFDFQYNATEKRAAARRKALEISHYNSSQTYADFLFDPNKIQYPSYAQFLSSYSFVQQNDR